MGRRYSNKTKKKRKRETVYNTARVIEARARQMILAPLDELHMARARARGYIPAAIKAATVAANGSLLAALLTSLSLSLSSHCPAGTHALARITLDKQRGVRARERRRNGAAGERMMGGEPSTGIDRDIPSRISLLPGSPVYIHTYTLFLNHSMDWPYTRDGVLIPSFSPYSSLETDRPTARWIDRSSAAVIMIIIFRPVDCLRTRRSFVSFLAYLHVSSLSSCPYT